MKVDEIWKQVVENHVKLASCEQHEFTIDLFPDRPVGKRWKCTHCGGEVDSNSKDWYERGLEHGRL